MLVVNLPLSVSAASSEVTDKHSSSILNRTMSINVYLPPSYSTNTTKDYPVLYLLHGMWGTYVDWQKNGMQSIVDNAGGKEMIIIMPDGLDALYVDGYQSGMKYETYMHDELIPYVESKYRIDTANGKNRAIAGLSMGGFGAAYHGFKYPDMFSSIYAMSGAFEVTGDLASVVNKNNYPAFTMECGTEDTLVYQMNVSLHNNLQQMGVAHEYITRSGAHTWDFWKACLPKAIVFASKHFSEGSVPTPPPPATSTDNPQVTPPGTVRLGDINSNGTTDSTDYALLKRYLLGLIDESSINIGNADMNSDGEINSTDYSILKRVLLGTIEIGKPPEVTPTSQPGKGALPAVDSVDKDGPFTVVIDKNVGTSRKAWVIRPAELGSQGVDKHPIYIWGPGGGEPDATKYEDILRRIASHGFVIYSEASTNSGAEMKVGIDWLISQNNDSSSPYYNKLDTEKIAAGGHSLGSVAAYGVASDPRITTTIHISGGSLDGSGASKMRKPIAIICGLNDSLALGNSRTDYDNAKVSVWYGELVGVDHLGGPKEGVSATLAWLRWHLAGETERKSMFIEEGAVYNTGKWQSKYKNW